MLNPLLPAANLTGMRICLDIQSAIAQQAGVGRYTRMLARHLGGLAQGAEMVFFYFDFMRRGSPFEMRGGVQKRCRWAPGRLAQAAWKRCGFPPFELFAGPADLYHFPNFILPPLRRGRAAVTVHDMSFLRFPEFAEERNLAYLTSRIHDTVERADAIITDSKFSADEIVELLGVPSERVFPIHLGVDDAFSRAAPRTSARSFPAEWNLDRPYILAVGTVEPRKNLEFLVKVFEQLTDFDGCLVVAGMRGWKYEPVLERFERSRRGAGIRYLDYVDDGLLPGLYAGAELLAVPSFYEGFGFPPLEAMSAGTPVVSSAGGSLPEVLGSAALIVHEFDTEAWTEAIRGVLGDSSRREAMIRRGYEQVKQYRWSETASKTWDVYSSVLG